MSVNYGSKRTVVGAHYGTATGWPTLTAVLMALFTVVLLVQLSSAAPSATTSGPAFCPQWMKFLTLALIVALAWHAWIGVRDIWMDYVKPVGLRLALQVVTIVWLVGCIGWGIQVLWRL
jgi:succinate dehydrogenase / fumarate reductase membrane anchor subunit